MGMDLIVAVAVQEHPDRTIEELRDKLNALSVGRANAIFERVEQIDFVELYGDDEDVSVVDVVKGWIEEFIAVACQQDLYHRSIIIMQHPKLDKIIAIGGGDSWGDTPAGLNCVTAAAEWGEW